MPIILSKSLKNQIASANGLKPEQVEDELWSQSSQKCFLCDGQLNRASDTIEVDHHIPQSEGGGHEFSNIRLAHSLCNKWKRNNNTNDVAPFLRFRRFYEENGSHITFSKAQEFLNSLPKDVYTTISKDSVTFELPNGTKPKVPIFSESVGSARLNYCFVELTLDCLWNDSEVQPRDVKLNHLHAISMDLFLNPLHEQPACRLEGKKLYLFDGQHKTLAKALNGVTHATFKVYLDLSRAAATVLVNSVQAKIKKLPLTPFELAAKLTDELLDYLELYQDKVGQDKASEQGFIRSLEQSDRKRASQAIEAQRIDSVMKAEDFEFRSMIEMKGHKVVGLSIKENAFQNKVLKRLLMCAPLSATFAGEEMRKARERETTNVVRIMNILYEYAFEPALVGAALPEEKTRAERIAYQAALGYVAELLLRIAQHRVVASDTNMAFIEKTITEEQWAVIKQDIKRLVEHPIWTADLKQSGKTRAVEDALSKNQGADDAFKAVRLTAGYCVGADSLSSGALSD
ncbi:MAG: HNH endonuclease [Mesorhizobium sp.]|nr:MAG: HNH endonuclease [Mesorhizobium sp.]